MKFYVDINVRGLPTTEYSTSAGNVFKELDQDVLLANHVNYARRICFRDGRFFEGLSDQKGPGDICTLIFDDFVPGLNLDDNPEWYELLIDRIVAVRAQECYGPGQGITVAENVTHGSAVARIRNQQAEWGKNGELVYEVKIIAKGFKSLSDARHLHAMILANQQ